MTVDIQSTSAISDPDRELVQRARGGDFGAFETLVAKYERPLYTLAMRIVHKPEDAEEVVQETFLAVVEHIAGFAERSTFYTWIVRIATNHALKILRKRRGLPMRSLYPSTSDDDYAKLPHPQFIAEWRDDPARIAQQHEIRDLLEQALDQLDEKYRLVFLLRDVEGLSTQQTADLLGISQTNAKVRLLRARLMLREQLTRKLGDEARQVVPDHSHDS